MKRIFICCLTIFVVFSSLISCKKEEVPSDCTPERVEFTSVDDLISALKAAKQKQSNNEELTEDEKILVDLEDLPVPSAVPANYDLKIVYVTKYDVHYSYYKEGETREYKEVEPGKYESQVIKYWFNHEDTSERDGFEVVKEQYRTQSGLEPTEDGVIYDEYLATVTFRVGRSHGSVIVPKPMNTYETILPLCQYEIVEITDNTETEAAP